MYACACNDKLIRQNNVGKLMSFPEISRKTQHQLAEWNQTRETIWLKTSGWGILRFLRSLSRLFSVFFLHSSLHNCHWLTLQASRLESSHPEAQKQQQRSVEQMFMIYKCFSSFSLSLSVLVSGSRCLLSVIIIIANDRARLFPLNIRQHLIFHMCMTNCLSKH